MRRILLAALLMALAGCAPDSEESIAMCRAEALEVIQVEAADYDRRKNRHIEHCMRAFGYVWDERRADCDHYQRFREGEALNEDAAAAGRCFRSAFDDRSRLADRIADWLN